MSANDYNLEKLDEILNQLRQKGIRITEPRKAVISYLINSQNHPTVEDIHQELKNNYPKMSLATVYNNINFFVEQGIVNELKFSNQRSRYDFMDHHHYHIICEKCGRIADFQSDDLQKICQAAVKQTDFQVFHSQVELFGLCLDCQKEIFKPQV